MSENITALASIPLEVGLRNRVFIHRSAVSVTGDSAVILAWFAERKEWVVWTCYLATEVGSPYWSLSNGKYIPAEYSADEFTTGYGRANDIFNYRVDTVLSWEYDLVLHPIEEMRAAGLEI